MVVSDLGAFSAKAYAVALRPDGKIVIAGNSREMKSQSFDIFIARYEYDGKIVAVGHSYSSPALGPDIAVARYDKNGKLDPSFGQGGMLSISPVGLFAQGGAAAIQGDGRIVVAGSATLGLPEYYEIVLLRCLGDKAVSGALAAPPPISRDSYDEADYSSAEAPAGLIAEELKKSIPPRTGSFRDVDLDYQE